MKRLRPWFRFSCRDATVRLSSNEPDERILAMLRQVEPIALLIVVATTTLILGLWFTPHLAAFAPPVWSKMAANSAVCLLLAACSLALSVEGRPLHLLRLSEVAGLVVLMAGVLTLDEYAAHVSLGIDAWLPMDADALYPGRPSPQTSLGLALLGTSLLLIRAHKSLWSLVADASALALVALCLVLIAGHIYGALDLVGIDVSTLTSPQTLVCFSCLAFVVVCRRAEHGRLLAVLVNIGIGSQIVRVMLPMVIFLPFALFAAVEYLISSRTMSSSQVYALAAAAASFTVLCAIVWMAWRINRLERQLRDLSLNDELTDVYNRRGFYFLAKQAFREAVRINTGLTVLFFDIDGLKEANDTAGHAAGSKLIKALASFLVSTFRESDIIGRLGGDEFAVVTLNDRGKAREGLTRLERRVADFNKSNGKKIPLKFSVGLAERIEGSAERFEDLVARADALMYEDKTAKQASERAAERAESYCENIESFDPRL
jgi:diguanylate cyclase (GGDEF)-like protein